MAELCNAKAKSTGERCRRPVVTGSTKCRFHGGKTPRGVASPHFQTGRYSKHLPARLMERYSEAAADPELLNMRHDIALLDARLSDVLGRVDTGESGRTWFEVRTAYNALINALRDQDATQQREAMRSLERLIGKGAADYAAWNEIANLLEQRRKLVEAEQKRLVAMEQMVTAEQAMGLATALLAAVKEHVTDRDTLSSIQDEFTRLVGAGNRPRVDAGK